MAKVLRAPKIDATTMTAMQELASAWVFKRAIQDNKVFRSGCIKGNISPDVTRLAIYLFFEIFIDYVYLILVLSNPI